MNNAISLIVNDGKADKLIFGSDFLAKRIEAHKAKADPSVSDADKMPSVAEISRTHLVLMSSTYKLHVPSATEYFKMIPATSQGPLQETTREQIISFRLQNSTEYIADCVLEVEVGEIRNGRKYVLNPDKLKLPTWVVSRTVNGVSNELWRISSPETMQNNAVNADRVALMLDRFTEEQLAVDIRTTANNVRVVPWSNDVRAAASVVRTVASDVVPPGTAIFTGTKNANWSGNGSEAINSDQLNITIEWDHAIVKDGEYIPANVDLPAKHAPHGRWFDFPGHRLIRESTFEIAGAEMSKYYSDDYSIFEKTRLSDDKRDQYHALVGQAVTRVATGPVLNGVQVKQSVTDGPQVPKPFPLEPQRFLIPSLHWFNRLEHSLPIGNLVAQNVELRYRLSGLTDLVKVVPAPLNKVTITRNLYGNTPSDEDEVVVNQPITMENYRESPQSAQTGLSTPYTNCLVYACGITVSPELANVLANKSHFQLIRLVKSQILGLNKKIETQLQVSDLRLPTEYFIVGARPTDTATKSDPDLWHRFNFATIKTLEKRHHIGVGREVVDLHTKLVHERNMFTAFGCKAFSQEIYKRNDLRPLFFTSYMPYIRGGKEFHTFKDGGLMFLPFALLPGQNQPSGHLNLNRTNLTFNFEYESDVIGSEVPNAEMFVSTSVINFLLVMGNAAVLRFH